MPWSKPVLVSLAAHQDFSYIFVLASRLSHTINRVHGDRDGGLSILTRLEEL